MRLFYSFLACVASLAVQAQFSPDGGKAGSTALHRDSVMWQGWAVAAQFEIGWIDVAQPALGRQTMPATQSVLGVEDGIVASLGDGGVAILEFDPPLADGPGPDFAVFENGFAVTDSSGFYELAQVAVSSDGRDFHEFASTSLTPGAVASFGLLQPTLIDGLAGKVSAPYGVPFDLADLAPDAALNPERIRFVRITDVIGTLDSAFAKTDSEGIAIADPYPTPFPAGGFDLDAVGAIHTSETVGIVEAEYSSNKHLKNSPKPVLLLSRAEAAKLTAGTKTLWRSLQSSAQAATIPHCDGLYILETVDAAEVNKRLVYLQL